ERASETEANIGVGVFEQLAQRVLVLGIGDAGQGFGGGGAATRSAIGQGGDQARVGLAVLERMLDERGADLVELRVAIDERHVAEQRFDKGVRILLGGYAND